MTSFSSLTWYDGYIATLTTVSVTLPATSDGDLLLIGIGVGGVDGSSPVSFQQAGDYWYRLCDGTESGGTAVINVTSPDLDRFPTTPRYHWDAVVVLYTGIESLGAVTEAIGLDLPTITHVTGGGGNKAKVTDAFTRYTGQDGAIQPYSPISYFYFAQGRLSDNSNLSSSVSGATSRSSQSYSVLLQKVVYEVFDILSTDLDTVIAAQFVAEAPAPVLGETAIETHGYLVYYTGIFLFDSFDNAIEMVCGETETDFSNFGYTKEVGEPNHAGDAGGASVWFYLVPTEDSTVTVSVDAAFTALLAVYTGADLASLVEVDSDSGATPSVTFSGIDGVTYWIAVDGAGGATGLFDISIDCVPVGTASSGPYWGIKLSA